MSSEIIGVIKTTGWILFLSIFFCFLLGGPKFELPGLMLDGFVLGATGLLLWGWARFLSGDLILKYKVIYCGIILASLAVGIALFAWTKYILLVPTTSSILRAGILSVLVIIFAGAYYVRQTIDLRNNGDEAHALQTQILGGK